MAKSRSWSVREAVAGRDDAALAELFQTVFGFARSVEHDQWKFADNPNGPPVVAVAEDQGKLVGQYALWPLALRLGNEVVRGAQSLDTMTHPDYRGQGMFTVLAEECMRYASARGIEALYGFPNENSYPGFTRKLDWDCTGNVQVWMRPLCLGSHHRVPAWASPLATWGARLLPRGGVKGFDIRREAPSAPQLDALLESCWRSKTPRCAVERSAAFWNWRFAPASGMNYRWICAWQGAELVALAVWGVDIRNGNAVLAELVARDAGAAQAVLSQAVGEALYLRCPLMMAVSSRLPLEGSLRRCGFFRSAGLPLIVRKLTARTLGANVHTHANWDVFGADLDTF